ncbi:bifunctional bis(5'-adenosyl)-triphosphatase/adenylylsulfatase FHIT isoform X1 [Cryptomeria japonica]|uniref:bifunctional bis(5'-adenosyl)-triphosphatase/adenylylsulfatase FHIT isoform X1 n=1 Tax=Cryptomeria japonica TaxID=3369 RepID=UPI0027DA9200|nr:bifunctional bis(5'-adenosyl)-triphosphatase/adenylylsulfatase FHIT isoform X1 [Cryptomeria japonica]
MLALNTLRPYILSSFHVALRSYRTPFLSCRLPIHTLTSSSVSAMDNTPEYTQDSYDFGPYKIDKSEVFYTTELSFALVNLRPVVPGHVLVCPKRMVKRFTDLTKEETTDLWLSAQHIGSKIESHFQASSLTFTIQDGPQSGQTVPHVHIHILPRKVGDFEKSDEVYDVIDEKEVKLKEKLDLDKERKDRSRDEMVEEGNELRALFCV